jgi:hypothetical protein
MSHAPPAAVVLLGAQRFNPSLGAAVSELGVTGRIALVTAGWQERESEDDELSAHLGGRTVNLKLHARGEELFRDDLELRNAHRERQDALRHRQDFYKIRLEFELEAERVIRHRVAPADIVAEQARESIDAIRELDRTHLASCARLRNEFDKAWKPAKRASVARHRAEIARAIEGCQAVAIAGGHVATLINRLSLFGLGALVADKIVFAWSGGAMAISERVVLFHDSPPQGPGASEVLDAGLGLVPGLVLFPQPEQRLHLDNTERVQSLVRRFAPARCLALPSRSRVTFSEGRLSHSDGVLELLDDGKSAAFETPAAALPGGHR